MLEIICNKNKKTIFDTKAKKIPVQALICDMGSRLK